MKHLLQGSAVAALVGGLASPVLAQDNVGVADLQARVEALEAATENTSSGLSFGLGETTTVSIYGFVRAEAFYDFDTVQGDLTRTGRIGDESFDTNGEFDTSVRVTRFGILSSTPTAIGDIDTQLEFDLFGSGGDESSSPNLRLRHANINIDDTFRVGQFWTNFMPLSHYPRTADFNGPVGIAFARVPQARYTYAANGLEVSASIEESNGGGSSDPVGTLAVFYDGGNYSVRAAGLVGTFDEGDEEFDTNAFTVSGSISPFAGTTLSGTYVTGQAIGNLLIGGGARTFNGDENDAEGFTVEIRQDVSEKLSIGAAYGQESYDDPTFIGGGTNDFTDLDSIFVNAFYTPVDNLTIAAEYSRGRSENDAGNTTTADRIGASVTFSF